MPSVTDPRDAAVIVRIDYAERLVSVHDAATPYIAKITGRESVSRITLWRWMRDGYRITKHARRVMFPYIVRSNRPYTTVGAIRRFWEAVQIELACNPVQSHEPKHKEHEDAKRRTTRKKKKAHRKQRRGGDRRR